MTARRATALRCRLAPVLLVSLLCARCGTGEPPAPPPVHPARGAEVPIRRVPATDLMLAAPGVLVVREPAHWDHLWRSYSLAPLDTPPPVDFSREMVAAVSMGSSSGCANSAQYVWKVERGRDTLFVVLGDPAQYGGGDEETCMMVIAPVDLVIMPRSELPIAFVASTSAWRVPPRANWLSEPRPTPAEGVVYPQDAASDLP